MANNFYFSRKQPKKKGRKYSEKKRRNFMTGGNNKGNKTETRGWRQGHNKVKVKKNKKFKTRNNVYTQGS